MKISEKGVELIKEFEGLRLEAYYDGGGVLTIGYGHTANVYNGQVITETEALELLREDINEHAGEVNNYLSGLTQNQYDAVVSLVFNLGGYQIFRKHYNNGYPSGSSIYNLLKAGEMLKASERFEDFVKDNGVVKAGLVRRRKKEKALFLRGSFFFDAHFTCSCGLIHRLEIN